jgi:CheY-like chemotaxis protein
MMASILIIDDDETTRALIGVAVEELGHQPTYAHDGQEGVDMVKAESYDVVFMDLAMPNKNGLVAIQEIMAEYPATKIVAISGVDTDMLERALEYGAIEALPKPLTPKQVQDIVDGLLRGRPTGGWDDVQAD